MLFRAGVDGHHIKTFESVAQAVDLVKKVGDKKVLAWGSFFTVSQTLEALD
jgi:acetylglutamate kinase